MRTDQQEGCVLWFTGLPGSGKTTLATALSRVLVAREMAVSMLDGDQLRSGPHADLGFSDEDRTEHVRRVAYKAKALEQSGNVVLVALISPFERDRQMARAVIGKNFLEVFVNCPLEVCEQRDVKGLYQKARSGVLKAMTGIDSAYEVPRHPDIELHTNRKSISECIELLVSSPNFVKLL